jgi:hypothetical protein
MSTDDTKRAVMLACLEIAVPMAMPRVARMSHSERAVLAEQAMETISSGGDAILYREKTVRGSAAKGFTDIAHALAILAHGPGGVTWLGVHWCDTWPCAGHADEEAAA